MYIHEKENWTDFYWNQDEISIPLANACRELGRLYGKLENIGFENKLRAVAENMIDDIVRSSEIEGIKLNTDEVRSSVAYKLGIESLVSDKSPSHEVEEVVSATIDAMKDYAQPITKERLCNYQSAFFPKGVSGGSQIETGKYRTHEEHIVSGMFGREKVHYIAPSPDRVETEMKKFIDWFNTPNHQPAIIRSAIAHLWFVSIHPFEDGNGRLSRILADIWLARGDNNAMRFYNISSQINNDKKNYYKILETVQHGNGDITIWLKWYIETLLAAVRNAELKLGFILNKSLFWMRNANSTITERQRKIINIFLDGYEAKITSKTWASLAKCSTDTALRDIQSLVAQGILINEKPDSTRPSYYICISEGSVIMNRVKSPEIDFSSSEPYLNAIIDDKFKIHEKILKLDGERFRKGEISVYSIVKKYCGYMLG